MPCWATQDNARCPENHYRTTTVLVNDAIRRRGRNSVIKYGNRNLDPQFQGTPETPHWRNMVVGLFVSIVLESLKEFFMHKTLLCLLLLGAISAPVQSQTSAPVLAPARLRVDRDLEYAQGGANSLKLDLYTREGITEPAPVVVWIHGAGGDKAPCPAASLVAAGYAVASIDYRRESAVPDGKVAIRWLRANAQQYHLD